MPKDLNIRSLRLAAFGFLHESSGSSATALFHVLGQILDRGHAVDFYHLPGQWKTEWLADRKTLQTFEVTDPASMEIWRWIDRLYPRLPRAVGQLLMAGFAQFSNAIMFARIKRRIQTANAQRQYDAVMALNMLSPWRIDGLRMVSWPQGPPRGESEFLARNARILSQQLGRAYFGSLMAGYCVKQAQYRANAKKSDLIIVGSRWSVAGWQKFGIPPTKLAALPFPLGPEAMAQPTVNDRRSNALMFLHIGRVVPRKRVDLLLRGFSEFRQIFPQSRLLVVGRQDYGRDLEILRSDPAVCIGVEFRDAVPRREVAALIASADCVVQTSENENFGAAIAEALAAGRPVLVGPTNGTKDYVSASSVVFSDYSPRAVAAGMAEIARRIQEAKTDIALEARTTAEQHFHLGRVTDRFLELMRNQNNVAIQS